MSDCCLPRKPRERLPHHPQTSTVSAPTPLFTSFPCTVNPSYPSPLLFYTFDGLAVTKSRASIAKVFSIAVQFIQTQTNTLWSHIFFYTENNDSVQLPDDSSHHALEELLYVQELASGGSVYRSCLGDARILSYLCCYSWFSLLSTITLSEKHIFPSVHTLGLDTVH